MKDAIAILRFLLDAADRGERTALVTITDVIGSSARAPGTHMAVTESGSPVGSFSGGCVEAAVIGEALRVIAGGEAEMIRLGTGSPLIDIRLPCGGGFDLLFVPQPSTSAIHAACERLEARQDVALRIARDGVVSIANPTSGAQSGWDGDTFVAYHRPDLRLIVLGHGAEVLALASLGQAYGIPVTTFSPDETIVVASAAAGHDAFQLRTPARIPSLVTDARTAVVFLFHDHDWEGELMAQVLEQDAFYIGAMGSRHTHAERMAGLIESGVPPAQANRVVGPIGLIPASRDPDTLALSVLAQIVERADGRSHEGTRDQLIGCHDTLV